MNFRHILLITFIIFSHQLIWAQTDSSNYELEQGKSAYQRGNWLKAYNLFIKNKGSKQFNADYTAMLANIYLFGSKELQHCEDGLRILDSAIAKDSDRAKRTKAMLYERGGCGFDINKKLAEEWYLKASEKGDPRSLYFLAIFYRHDTLYTTDKIITLLEQAGKLGESDAYNEIGRMYQSGQSVKIDYAKAGEWYREAAKNGNFFAQANLGYLYYYGYGVPKDHSESLRWYMLAAEKEYAEAYYQVGNIYYYGDGVGQNYSQAISWYEKAAEEGDSRAKYRLGEMYQNSEGVPKDIDKAKWWYRQACESGHMGAKRKLELLGGNADDTSSGNDTNKKKKKTKSK